MRRRVRLCLIALFVGVVPSASAHSSLQDVGTQDAGTLRLVFSAPVEDAFLRATALDGAPLAATVDPEDPQAVLVRGGPPLAVRVLSRDGHVSRAKLGPTGAATAAVGNPLLTVGDLLLVCGLTGLIGLVVFRAGVLAPAVRSGRPRPPGREDVHAWQERVVHGVRRGLGVWTPLWWGALGLAVTGLLLGAAGMFAALDAVDAGALAGTRWGTAWLIEAACIASAAAVALATSRAATDAAPRAGRAAALAAGPVVGACAVAWSGHASVGTDAWAGISIDALHILATATWLGALAGMLAFLPRIGDSMAAVDATRLSAGLVVRFSAMAIGAVGVLVVTGVYRAIGELSAVDDLVDTAYGRALLVKLALFGVLLGLGAVNRLVLHPRLERAALGLRPGDQGAGDTLRRTMTAEIATAVVLLAVVAVMVNLPPP